MKTLYRLAIGLYQQKISPRKGFRCAYSVEHGGPGCSGAVLSILEQKGLINGWGMIKARFHDCESAAKERKKRHKKKPDRGGSKSCLPGQAGDCLDIGDCIPDGKCSGPCDGPCDISTSLRAIATGVFRR